MTFQNPNRLETVAMLVAEEICPHFSEAAKRSNVYFALLHFAREILEQAKINNLSQGG